MRFISHEITPQGMQQPKNRNNMITKKLILFFQTS